MSARALACADRRPRRSEPRGISSAKGSVLEATGVVAEGANHRTRGRVRSPLEGIGQSQDKVNMKLAQILNAGLIRIRASSPNETEVVSINPGVRASHEPPPWSGDVSSPAWWFMVAEQLNKEQAASHEPPPWSGDVSSPSFPTLLEPPFVRSSAFRRSGGARTG
jgi:hypothetical protein